MSDNNRAISYSEVRLPGGGGKAALGIMPSGAPARTESHEEPQAGTSEPGETIGAPGREERPRVTLGEAMAIARANLDRAEADRVIASVREEEPVDDLRRLATCIEEARRAVCGGEPVAADRLLMTAAHFAEMLREAEAAPVYPGDDDEEAECDSCIHKLAEAERARDEATEGAQRAVAKVAELTIRLADLGRVHSATIDRLHEVERREIALERRLAALLERQGEGQHTAHRDGGIGEVVR